MRRADTTAIQELGRKLLDKPVSTAQLAGRIALLEPYGIGRNSYSHKHGKIIVSDTWAFGHRNGNHGDFLATLSRTIYQGKRDKSDISLLANICNYEPRIFQAATIQLDQNELMTDVLRDSAAIPDLEAFIGGAVTYVELGIMSTTPLSEQFTVS